MAFICVNTTNKNIERELGLLAKGDRRSYIQKHFIRKLGPGTYLLDGNAAALALVYDIKKRYDGSVYIYIAESLTDSEIPKKVREVVEKCKGGEKRLLRKELEELEKIKMRCSMSLKGSSSE